MPWLYTSLHTKTRQLANWEARRVRGIRGKAQVQVLPALFVYNSLLPVLHWCKGTSNWSYWLLAFLQILGLSDFVGSLGLDTTNLVSCKWKQHCTMMIKMSAAVRALCLNRIHTRPKRVLVNDFVCTFSFCPYLQEATEEKQLEQSDLRVSDGHRVPWYSPLTFRLPSFAGELTRTPLVLKFEYLPKGFAG